MTMRRPTGDCLKRLRGEGVSVWLDGLSRELLTSGELAKLAAERPLAGLTTAGHDIIDDLTGPAYRAQLDDFTERGSHPQEAARRLLAFDARGGCDVFLRSYRASSGRTGLVSIEPAPVPDRALAAEARAAWWAVDRPNLLLKLPPTEESLGAVSELVAEGVGVDVTPVFSVDRYEQVQDALFTGLERARRAGLRLGAVHTAVSLPIAPVDAAADARLADAGAAPGRPPMGRTALAHARLVYHAYERGLGGDRWRALAAAGAHPPRLVWTATEARGPAGPDTRYADGLVAWGVTSSMSRRTLDAVSRRALLSGDTLSGRHVSARLDLAALAEFGVGFARLSADLERSWLAGRRAVWEELCERVAKLLSVTEF
ncbi:transaldolase family protein [Streptomyces sp. NPDC048248]|uniref:transaldolase family protein n=1 Tax=Streptomyces sp. NPDC048248 TaxID=3365523 RepID=UPI0037194A71